MKKQIAFFVLCLAAIALIVSAAPSNHYIRAGASGNGSGSDWTNACTGFSGACAPSSMVRGDTYYLAGGSYSGANFSAASSGTTLITIKGATTADHGTDTGWSTSFGVDVTQVSFKSSIAFSSSYWMFDGVMGPVWSRVASQYGFTFTPQQYPIAIFNDRSVVTHVTVAHIAAIAPSGDVEKFFVSTDNTNPGVSAVTMSNLYLSGWQNAYWATSPGKTMDSWIFQYCMCLNGFSSNAHHGEWINNNYGRMTNQITRWNWFDGQQNGTGVIVANNNDNVNAQVYGNVFNNIAEGNGIITGTSSGNLVSPQVFNNTFVNCSSGGWIGGNVTGTPVIQNNLIYKMSGSMSVRGDYNAYFSTTDTPKETHGQVSTANPFVNASTLNYQLAAETSPGIPLTAPFNVDVLGNARPGSDGVWSRGTYQFGGSTPPPPPAITVTIAPTAATVLVNGTQQFTVSVANDPSNAGVTWSTNAPGGIYTAPGTVPTPATVTVKATSVTDPTKSASATVTIAAPPLVWSCTLATCTASGGISGQKIPAQLNPPSGPTGTVTLP